ncbi:MAG: hypothetical protein KBT70_14980 [Roseovarius sp.]|jgi:hypothetical protein|uniref:hypothetical protein n=1 Tax=Roseovarius sp. TaxID=1486281 RepID=UPI001B4F2C2D|nr:hypothetical protein [Roseovarius sp.]MBQ0751495.1 hypothetical protein [Roseovarius sp.]MBQ0809060.1 hypothetical protein [Roseovarius sp.]
MTYFEITLYALAVLCMIALPLILAVSIRMARMLAHLSGRMFHMSESEMDHIARRLGHKLGLSDEASLMSIADRMDEMRRDFDWLVSDRMIEQAIDMARFGQKPDSIARNTGISASELEAIRKLRKH